MSRYVHLRFLELTLLLLYSTTALSGCWLLNEPNRAGGFFHKNISADFFTSRSFIKVTMTTFDRYKLQYNTGTLLYFLKNFKVNNVTV